MVTYKHRSFLQRCCRAGQGKNSQVAIRKNTKDVTIAGACRIELGRSTVRTRTPGSIAEFQWPIENDKSENDHVPNVQEHPHHEEEEAVVDPLLT